MLYHLSALAIISLVLGLAAVRRISIYSPLVMGSAVWFSVFVAGIAFNDRFYPLKDDAFIAWIIWFLITSLIYFLITPTGVDLKDKFITRKLPFDYSPLLGLLIVWLVYRIWIVGSNGSEHFFLNLRLSTNGLDGFEPLGLVGLFYPLVFALFLFEHVYARRDNRRLRVLCWIWMLAYALATMGKFAVLTPILSWAVIQGLQGKLPVKKLIGLGGATFCLMLVAHFVRSGSEDNLTIFGFLATYIYSPVVALGYMDLEANSDWGAYVFRFVYAVGHSLGFAPEPAEVILPYVSVPSLTNVYTVMHPFYFDFGPIGLVLGAIYYAFFFGVLFLLAFKFKGIFLAIFSAYSIALLGQFFADLFLSGFSGNLQVFLALVLVFFASRRERYVC